MRSHELVLAWIEDQLGSGALAVGQRLPGERALAGQLGVSRTSVREAIRILEALGVIRSGVGSGPEAGTLITADPTTALGSALRLHVATSHLPVSDIVQTRVLLESWAVQRADPLSPALTEAARLLDAMDDPAVDAPRFHELDAAFHVALSEAAGNILISAMMASLRESIQRYTLSLIGHLPDWNATASRLRQEHRALLNAIVAGLGADAAELVTLHIEGYFAEAGH